MILYRFLRVYSIQYLIFFNQPPRRKAGGKTALPFNAGFFSVTRLTIINRLTFYAAMQKDYNRSAV